MTNIAAAIAFVGIIAVEAYERRHQIDKPIGVLTALVTIMLIIRIFI